MPKTVNVRVTTVDAELEFSIENSTKGKEFFDRVTKAVGVRESWYFGLQFIDTTGLQCWLDLGKKISSQNVRKESPLKFKFLAKYFPEDAAEELILYHTKYLFYKQVNKSVLAEEYFCSAETAVLLASYAVQVKFGEYESDTHKPGFLGNEQLLPPRVIKQHSLTKAEWDERILTWYKEHVGLNKETVIIEYLKIAQDLEMYGISYFEITNKKGTKLWLGVDALGINIYNQEDKLTPKIGFPWSEVRNVSYSGKKFVVKPTDAKSPDFTFTTTKPKINQQILGLCTGNFELYSRRRKPDTVEVRQMKDQVKEENALKEAERKKLLREKQQREESEMEKKRLEQTLQEYIREVEISKEDLIRSRQSTVELENKLSQLEQTKMELEESRRRAEEAMRFAEETANSEKAEREMKENEANYTQFLLEQKIEEATRKEEEARKLQEELEQAKMLITQRMSVEEYSGSSSPGSDLMKYQRKKVFDGNHVEFQGTRVVMQSVDSSSSIDRESKELQVDFEMLDKFEENRIREVDANVTKSQKLEALRKELNQSKVEKEITRNDLIYVKNITQGRDKYKTLKQIRQGNTKIRVELYESL